MHPVDLITVSREYGAGGSELAVALGRRLGWRVLDKDIAAAVAARVGVPAAALEEWDEHVPSLLENIGNALMVGSPEVMVNPEVARLPHPDDVARVTREILLDAARHGPLIVVGHGTQSLFHTRPGALHVRLVAPMGSRARRVCGRRGCGERDAVRLAQRMDADRLHYVQRHYGRDVRDPMLYHIQINSGLVVIEDAAALILDLVQRQAPAHAMPPAHSA